MGIYSALPAVQFGKWGVKKRLKILNSDTVGFPVVIKAVAGSHGIQPVQIRYWRNKQDVLTLTKPKARTVNKGKQSIIKHLECPIIGWALEMCQLGIAINCYLVVVKASQIDTAFREKLLNLRYNLIQWLCQANCLVQRRQTHISQEHPQEAIDRAKGWLEETRPILNAPTARQKYVINMEQTPLPFSPGSSTTLELKGERTVTV